MMTLGFFAKSQLGQSQLCQSSEPNFSLDWELLFLSHLFMAKATGEKKHFQWKLSATALYCRVYSMLEFILHQEIRAETVPVSPLNQGGDEFSLSELTT